MLKTRAFQIITKTVNSASVQELFTPPETDENGILTDYSALIESLMLYVKIQSLVEVPLPTGLGELGDAEAAEAYKNYQWSAERYQIELYRKRFVSSEWLPFAAIPLLRRDPFYMVDLMPYLANQVTSRLAPKARLGYRIVDAGYGVPMADDLFVFHGEGLAEADVALVGQEDLSAISSRLDALDGTIGILQNAVTDLATRIANIGTITPQPEPEPEPATPNSGSFITDGNAVIIDGSSAVTW